MNGQTIFLGAVLLFLIYLFWIHPRIMKGRSNGQVWGPIRNSYISQTKGMIKKYNIEKEELFDE